MSVDRAYAEVVKNRKGSPVVVAIIDSGIDLAHEELQDLLWKNPKEIAGDGLDNDQNGYIDDVHGYNFLGESYHEQMEFVRIVSKKLGDVSLQKKTKVQVVKLLSTYRVPSTMLTLMWQRHRCVRMLQLQKKQLAAARAARRYAARQEQARHVIHWARRPPYLVEVPPGLVAAGPQLKL
jgi:hypothetical protein